MDDRIGGKTDEMIVRGLTEGRMEGRTDGRMDERICERMGQDRRERVMR